MAPFNKYIPKYIHRLLDKHFGTLIYYRLQKQPISGLNQSIKLNAELYGDANS